MAPVPVNFELYRCRADAALANEKEDLQGLNGNEQLCLRVAGSGNRSGDFVPVLSFQEETFSPCCTRNKVHDSINFPSGYHSRSDIQLAISTTNL